MNKLKIANKRKTGSLARNMITKFCDSTIIDTV